MQEELILFIRFTILEISKILKRKILNSFLSISFNICFGCSKTVVLRQFF